MDKLLQVYLEESDPSAKISKYVDQIKAHMGSASMNCLALETFFRGQNSPELASFCKNLGEGQHKLMAMLENSLERYYPGIYRKK